jgi:hypothetical protein
MQHPTPSTDAGPETGRVVQQDAPANDEDVAEAGSACSPHPLDRVVDLAPAEAAIDPSALHCEIDGFIQACQKLGCRQRPFGNAFKQQNPPVTRPARIPARQSVGVGPIRRLRGRGVHHRRESGRLSGALSLYRLDGEGLAGRFLPQALPGMRGPKRYAADASRAEEEWWGKRWTRAGATLNRHHLRDLDRAG